MGTAIDVFICDDFMAEYSLYFLFYAMSVFHDLNKM